MNAKWTNICSNICKHPHVRGREDIFGCLWPLPCSSFQTQTCDRIERRDASKRRLAPKKWTLFISVRCHMDCDESKMRSRFGCGLHEQDGKYCGLSLFGVQSILKGALPSCSSSSNEWKCSLIKLKHSIESTNWIWLVLATHTHATGSNSRGQVVSNKTCLPAEPKEQTMFHPDGSKINDVRICSWPQSNRARIKDANRKCVLRLDDFSWYRMSGMAVGTNPKRWTWSKNTIQKMSDFDDQPRFSCVEWLIPAKWNISDRIVSNQLKQANKCNISTDCVLIKMTRACFRIAKISEKNSAGQRKNNDVVNGRMKFNLKSIDKRF